MIINQVNKDWDYTKDNMDAYCAEVRKLEKNFQGLEILHVLRDSNVAADVLAKLGSDRAKVSPGVFIEELPSPSIKQPGEITSEPPADHGLKISSTTSEKTSYHLIRKRPPG
jgi:hypothetical protein